MKILTIAFLATFAMPALADSITCEVKKTRTTVFGTETATSSFEIHPNTTHVNISFDVLNKSSSNGLTHTIEIDTVKYVENYIQNNPEIIDGDFINLRREDNKNTGRVIVYVTVGKISSRKIQKLESQAWDMGSIDGSVIISSPRILQNLICKRER